MIWIILINGSWYVVVMSWLFKVSAYRDLLLKGKASGLFLPSPSVCIEEKRNEKKQRMILAVRVG